MNYDFVQLNGPTGAFYVRPQMVVSIGPAHCDTYTFPNESRKIRRVTTQGSTYPMWDDAKNMQLLMDCS